MNALFDFVNSVRFHLRFLSKIHKIYFANAGDLIRCLGYRRKKYSTRKIYCYFQKILQPCLLQFQEKIRKFIYSD